MSDLRQISPCFGESHEQSQGVLGSKRKANAESGEAAASFALESQPPVHERSIAHAKKKSSSSLNLDAGQQVVPTPQGPPCNSFIASPWCLPLPSSQQQQQQQ